MLFLHETHRVAGRRADEFEAAWRGQLDALAKGDDARLLWFFHQAHGTGLSYVVVTITAVRASLRHGEGEARDGSEA